MRQIAFGTIAATLFLASATWAQNTVEPDTAPTEGVLIEAENFAAREPDREGFASVENAGHASAGAFVDRFRSVDPPSRLTWRFKREVTGRCYIWIRYGIESVGVIRAGILREGAELGRHRLPATKPDGWKWALIHAGDLEAGQYTLAVRAIPKPVHLDCIWVTSSRQRPSDALIRPPESEQP